MRKILSALRKIWWSLILLFTIWKLFHQLQRGPKSKGQGISLAITKAERCVSMIHGRWALPCGTLLPLGPWCICLFPPPPPARSPLPCGRQSSMKLCRSNMLLWSLCIGVCSSYCSGRGKGLYLVVYINNFEENSRLLTGNPLFYVC